MSGVVLGGGGLSSLLIVAHEPVGSLMTGPAIRCVELAKALVSCCEVAVAVPEAPGSAFPGVRTVTYRRDRASSLLDLAAEPDAILISGYMLEDFPELGRLGRPLIVDLCDPFPVENLEVLRSQPLAERTTTILRDFETVNRLLHIGDFFICGSETQRDFWLGMLAACARLNPLNHEADPTFRRLIDVVPMGIPENPVGGCSPVKGTYPGIGLEDFLVVWPGGVWDWLDPLTAVEAIERISAEAPDVKLLFLGLRHPHPERVGAMRNPDAVISRAKAAGLLGRQVLYNDWTPYEDRRRYMCGSDLAITLHFDHLESHLAVRARLLDCLWAETSAVVTAGDVIADEMARRGLAILVPPRDAAAVAGAILRSRDANRDRAGLAEQFRDMASEYRWAAVCRPLAGYLEDPQRAADRVGQGGSALPDEGENDRLRRLLKDTRQQLAERDAELASIRDLVDRIGRGKVMRLMNAARSLVERMGGA